MIELAIVSVIRRWQLINIPIYTVYRNVNYSTVVTTNIFIHRDQKNCWYFICTGCISNFVVQYWNTRSDYVAYSEFIFILRKHYKVAREKISESSTPKPIHTNNMCKLRNRLQWKAKRNNNNNTITTNRQTCCMALNFGTICIFVYYFILSRISVPFQSPIFHPI